MREIKFRAWYIKEKRMIEWDEIVKTQDNENFCLYADNAFSDVSPLMQYTGLKDKNGAEIYESDILRLDAHQDLFVEYYEDRFSAKSTNKVQRINWLPFALWEVVDMGYVVIGNIHENQELLSD